MASQSKFSSTLFLPFFAIVSLNSLLLITLLTPSAKSFENLSGSIGSKGATSCCSKGINNPVSPSTTTSFIPPTALATTAVSHAIASMFMIPKGSYIDGQQKTSA